MNQIENGLFTVEREDIPCSPRDITIPHYAFPGTLGRAEQEEAAARILSFSQQLGQWVGVSWRRLADMMLEEYEEHQQELEARNHNSTEQRRVYWAVRRYYIICILTLGIYALLAAKPTAQSREVPDAKVPFSGIFMFGPQHIATGIHELIERGFLQKVTEGEGDDVLDVFFPTPTLVSRIMQKQGVVSS